MKRGGLAAALFLSFVLGRAEVVSAGEGNPAPPAPPSGEGREKTVAARVNGVEITSDSVAIMMSSLGAKKGHETAPSKSVEDARREALGQLILQELAYQKARSEGAVAGKKEIDEVLADMVRKLGGEEKFREFMEREGVSEEELRKRAERNLTLRRIVAREVRNKVSVSEEDARGEYEKNRGSYALPEKTVVIDVIFFLDLGDKDSIGKAEGTRRKIQSDGENNPRNLASDGSFGVREIEVDESREKALYETAKTMKVGELSGVFSAEGNLHVILLKEYSPRREFAFEEVKGQIQGTLWSRAQQKRLEEWEAELKKDAKIEIVE